MHGYKKTLKKQKGYQGAKYCDLTTKNVICNLGFHTV